MKSDHAILVVTAANDKYIDSLIAMLISIDPARFVVGIFDLGLSHKSKDRIAQVCKVGSTIIDPGWRVLLPPSEYTPDYMKVFVAKPFIPQIFPGFFKYIWVDADIVFLDSSAIEDYANAAEVNGMAICYEDHPLYQKLRKSWWRRFRQRLGMVEKDYTLKRVRRYFGNDMALKWGDTPALNSGIFCITADSPVWSYWQDMMNKADLTGHERKRVICDQTCLNVAVLANGFAPTKMPATHNWCLSLAEPVLRKSKAQFVDPLHPHNAIKVFHSAGPIKTDFKKLRAYSAPILESLYVETGSPLVGDQIEGPLTNE